MPLTALDLRPFIHDPARVQQLMLSNINNFQINEATNPFTMLLEGAGTLSAATAMEHAASLRFRYPSLAIDTNDILAHVNTKQLPNLYSNPATTHMIFYLSVDEMVANAYRNDAQKCYETVIPSGASVTVSNTDFTLFNDIRVKLYDNGSVFAEQITSTNPVANNSIGILTSGIVSFQDNSSWVAVETQLKQLSQVTVNRAVSAAEGFLLEILHNDTYHTTTASYKSANTNGSWNNIAISHSDVYIDPMSPTMSATPLTGKVTYVIPDVYLLSGQISGEVMVNLYTTRGQVDMPLHKYSMADYTVNLNLATTDPVKASIANITVYANSRDVVSGGTTGYTFQELRNSIIHNTLGNTTKPVTADQLSGAAAIDGFELYNVLDMVTSKVYAAARNIPAPTSALIYTKPDVFFNTVAVETNKIQNANIVTTPTYVMLPSNTLFREVNGVTTPLGDTDLSYLASLTQQGLINYLQSNNVFTNPYYYILDLTTTSEISSRVYDLDTPTLNNIKIVGTNTSVVERANVGQYGLIKTTSGYELLVTVIMNSELTNSATDLIKGQLTLPLFGGNAVASYQGVFDTATGMIKFVIPTTFEITKQDRLVISGAVTAVTNTEVDLATRGSIYIYTEDPNVISATTAKYLNGEIYTSLNQYSVLDKEDIDIVFGRPITHLWDRLYITYNDNKYLKYINSVPAVYQHDVYDVDPATGSIIRVVTDPVSGVKSTTKTLLHAKGTQVLDANGNPVYQHKAGDIVLDSAGLPTIDTVGGVIRHVDILMLEYEYYAATATTQVNYLGLVKDTINGWLFTSVPNIANKALENTRVVYRSYKQSEPVACLVDSKKVVVPYNVKPTVTIYTTKTTFTTVEISILKSKIGQIIHKYLDLPHISMTDLKNEIISTVDSSIVTAKITGLEVTSDAEVFDVANNMTRLTLGKTLANNTNGELIVEYDITLLTHVTQ